MALDYLEYIHLNSSITTTDDFINRGESIVKSFQGEEDSFLNIEDDDGVSNAKRLWQNLDDDQKEEYPSVSDVDPFTPLNVGTLFYIPKDYLNNEIISIIGKGQFYKKQDVNAFLGDKLRSLLTDPDYVKSSRLQSISGKSGVNYVQLFAQVWIYIRAINRIIDITPFINNINTGVSKQGGNFNFSLDPIDDLSTLLYTDSTVVNYLQIEKDNFVQPFFHKNIQQNDIVFISFEELEFEDEGRRLRDIKTLDVSKTKLFSQNFDMIGLVDNNLLIYNATTNEPEINISGRDFTKLLTEDGSYFYPYALIEGSEDFFINSKQDSRFEDRLFVNSNFATFFAYSLRSIRDTLGFIFNQLTNVGVLPDEIDLFSSYGSEKSQKYEITGGNAAYLNAVDVKGVWQIVKFVVDKAVDDRRIVNSDITRPDGTLFEQVNKICQDPFVEFYGDTVGNSYTFIARQPIFTRSQILDFIDSTDLIIIKGEDVGVINLDWETEYYSMYQIQPQNSFIGKTNFIALAHIPVVYFPEYINAFGNHRKIVPCNYISYQALKGDNESINGDLFRSAIVNDFAYIIESNMYLPFTRRGSITIEGGDRRIKRGTWVLFEPTDELFYVDSVSNNLNTSMTDLQRQTRLEVNRGMKMDYIRSKKENKYSDNPENKWSKKGDKSEINVSYFDIINTDVIVDILKDAFSGQQINKDKTELILNEDIFNFFLQRRQM